MNHETGRNLLGKLCICAIWVELNHCFLLLGIVFKLESLPRKRKKKNQAYQA